MPYCYTTVVSTLPLASSWASIQYPSADVLPIFQEMSKRKQYDMSEELKQEDRHQIDSMLFDILGLTQYERDAVYEAVINLVESRLKKAGSV